MRYAFVDGNHLKLAFRDLVQVVHPGTSLDPDRIRSVLGVQKVFFYDAVPTVPDLPTGANQKAHDDRAKIEQKRRETLDLHTSLEEGAGFQIREGSTKKDKYAGDKLKQKEVDVLLAVEAINHAVRRNCSDMVLVLGDSDFIPLVRALVDYGMFVTLFGDPRKTDSTLKRFADTYSKLWYPTLVSMGTPQPEHQINFEYRTVFLEPIMADFMATIDDFRYNVGRLINQSAPYRIFASQHEFYAECYDCETLKAFLRNVYKAEFS